MTYVGFTFGSPENTSINYSQTEFLGISNLTFRGEKIKCYKFSNCYCDVGISGLNICEIVYLHYKALIPLKIEYTDFDCATKKSLPIPKQKYVYSLFGIMKMDRNNHGLHIWGQ